MRALFVISLILLVYPSCRNSEPKNHWQPDQYADSSGQDSLAYIVKVFSNGEADTTLLANSNYTESNPMHFLSSLFSVFREFPEDFIDLSRKGQMETVWADSTRTQNIKSNWSYTAYYDNKGRLSRYHFSSCLTCGMAAFNYIISYDSLDRPVFIQNQINSQDKYEFRYTRALTVGSVIQYSFDKIIKQASLAEE